MDTVEERAKKYADEYVVGDVAFLTDLIHQVAEESYIAGASEQKQTDIDKAKKSFDKACSGLFVYPWYDNLVSEFVKELENEG